ncbi:unnamed protein product [Dibothriocephalus latus]|uniref:Uncharacterized protein n=1 Tax=Dibothriocephalus latus TaxID=60516 RepID=A0A3P6U058_DIBLA|nr:unnamed protein product [Dibothriocephalus latus]
MKLLSPTQSLTIVKTSNSGTWNEFEMTMNTKEAKPKCRSAQSAALIKDVWCVIQTTRVDIRIELLMARVTTDGAIFTTVEHVSMAIPGAVLYVKLEEKLLDNSDPLAHILQLAELRIQNIISIIDEIQRSIPRAGFSGWNKWVLANTERILKQAVLQRGLEQCQW